MLKLSLLDVDRGEVSLQEQVPADDPLLRDLDARLSAPLSVDLRARSVGDGVLVRGTLRTSVESACRRCLTPVTVVVDASVDLLFEPVVGEEAEEVAGEVYPLPSRGTELDLSGPIREELVLHVPTYVLCEEDCRGLCPTCGADLNQAPCDCVPETAPSPWDALKKIKLD